MTFTVAFFILALGIAIGYRLPAPVARLKAAWRRRTYQPSLLQPFTPEPPTAPVAEHRNP